jgi:hypothetical protein
LQFSLLLLVAMDGEHPKYESGIIKLTRCKQSHLIRTFF